MIARFELHGAAAHPPEHKFPVTTFDSVQDKQGQSKNLSFRELHDLVSSTVKVAKAELPLLKLVRFGNFRSAKGSIRHDANVKEISGVEVDYDGEKVSFDEAVAKLRAAGLCFLAFTTPSHTRKRPRWRVIAFCSRPLPPEQRSHLTARLNGVLGGIVSAESFAISQIYYFGRVEGAEDYRVEGAFEGKFIDLCDELDAGVIGKANGGSAGRTDAASLEQYFKAQVDWGVVYASHNIPELKQSCPALFERLQRDLSRQGALAHRWTGGTEGLKDKSRSGRDRSVVQVLRKRGYTSTEAIACAAAWGGSNPKWGRGLEKQDHDHNDIDLERYWVRCWMRADDVAPVDKLPPSPPLTIVSL